MRLELVTTNESETIELGRAIGERLRAGDVVALVGELGAGKTRFVRGVAMAMGIDPTIVSSPTYVIVNEYESARDSPTLVHMDAYRLRGGEDLASLGWSQIQDDRAIVIIEWADRIDGDLPAGALRLLIKYDDHDADARRLRLTGEDDWLSRLEGLPFRR